MAKKKRLREHTYSEKDMFLLDTNILLYLFSDLTKNDYGYNDFFRESLLNGSKLFICETSISEYVNTYCRNVFNLYKDEKKLGKEFNFKKDFRGLSEYSTAYEYAIETIREEILPLVTVLVSSKDNIDKSISPGCDLLDFNDNILLQNALSSNLSIVTHDRDFWNQKSNVNIFHNY